MKKVVSKILFIACFCLFLPCLSVAEIEIPISSFSGPMLLNDGGEFDTDEFGDENSFKKEKSKKANKTKSKYSKTKAVLLSVLVPGAGHYYINRKGRGQVFFSAEVVAWFGYLAFQSYGNWKEDDYKKYAIQHAGITSAGHDESFYRNLLFYDSREEYNKSGRIINPGAPYYPNDPQYDWFWESSASRNNYRTMRNDSEVVYRKATFMLGVALVNRLIAGIDVFRLIQKESNRLEDNEFLTRNNIEFDIKADPFAAGSEFGFVIRHRF